MGVDAERRKGKLINNYMKKSHINVKISIIEIWSKITNYLFSMIRS